MTERQKQIIVGTVLGDSCIRKGKTDRHNFLSCQHGPSQKEYAEWKAKQFEDIGSSCKYYKRLTPNKKTGKLYECYAMRVNSGPHLLEFREMFYVDNKKVITDEVLKYYTPLAMAIHFMDDGCKYEKTYSIATNGFDDESYKKLRVFLLTEYDIETSPTKDRRIYIRLMSARKFEALIKPYILDCLKYKLVS